MDQKEDQEYVDQNNQTQNANKMDNENGKRTNEKITEQ